MSTVLVTGSRNWTNYGLIRWCLAWALAEHPAAMLRHGGARGADTLAARAWAELVPFHRIEVFEADWNQHGEYAGPLRNNRMVDAGADLCLAFLLPGSRGSVHCAQTAEWAGIRTVWIWDGTDTPHDS